MRPQMQCLVIIVGMTVVTGAAPDSLAADERPQTVRAIGQEQLEVAESPDASPQKLFRADQIIGTGVFNDAGREFGRIDELVVNTRNGAIRYAALAFPPIFNREKLFAIPWGSLERQRTTDGEDITFRLDVPLDVLREAPGFDRRHWPDVANRRFAEQIDIYFGVVIKEGDLKSKFGTDVGALAEAPHLLRSTKLIGIAIQDNQNAAAGRIEELVIDLDGGSVRYAVAAFPMPADVRHQLFPIPWQKLNLVADRQPSHFVLSKTDAAPPAPSFHRDRPPNLRDREWWKAVDRYYGLEEREQKSSLPSQLR